MAVELTVGRGSYKVHYGYDATNPRSVKCGNGLPNFDNISWSTAPELVTCKTCLRKWTPLTFKANPTSNATP